MNNFVAFVVVCISAQGCLHRGGWTQCRGVCCLLSTKVLWGDSLEAMDPSMKFWFHLRYKRVYGLLSMVFGGIHLSVLVSPSSSGCSEVSYVSPSLPVLRLCFDIDMSVYLFSSVFILLFLFLSLSISLLLALSLSHRHWGNASHSVVCDFPCVSLSWTRSRPSTCTSPTSPTRKSPPHCVVFFGGVVFDLISCSNVHCIFLFSRKVFDNVCQILAF